MSNEHRDHSQYTAAGCTDWGAGAMHSSHVSLMAISVVRLKSIFRCIYGDSASFSITIVCQCDYFLCWNDVHNISSHNARMVKVVFATV